MNQSTESPALQIVHYPHVGLREVAKTVRRVDQQFKELVAQMFDLMYAARGIGLAAPQVNLPLRLFIVNLEAEKGKGEELVFINPVVTKPKLNCEMEEGCLSLPGLYGPVVRPKQVRINAYDLTGKEIIADVSGMMARVVQHELDHLDGILFIDRMTEEPRAKAQPAVEQFEADYRSRCSAGEILSDEALAQQRRLWETRYCA